MKEMNAVIAYNLKRLRGEKNLSLDKVAKMTGVSKSMLGQIEREETNPTITTVWKIANGMKVSFTAFLEQTVTETRLVTAEDVEPFLEDEGRYRLYPFFPYEEGRNFEIYRVEIEPGGCLNAEPHIQASYEFVVVFEGTITIQTGDEVHEVSQGEAIKFRADQPHTYSNKGEDLVRVSMTIYYPE